MTTATMDAGTVAVQGALAQWAVQTDTALRLDPETPYDAWAEIGATLGTLGRAAPWWIGDWLRLGEHLYGEKYSQAMEATGYRYQTLANYTHVALRIAPEVRRADLLWSHHAQVSRFEDAATQRHWLERAVTEDWTVNELRAAIRAAIAEAAVGPEEDAADEQLTDESKTDWRQVVRVAALAVFVRWNDTAREGADRPLLPEQSFEVLADQIAERACEYAT